MNKSKEDLTCCQLIIQETLNLLSCYVKQFTQVI